MRKQTANNDIVYRNLLSIIGITLIVVALFVAISLVTWSVDDPSLSYASGGKISNWMGKLGAIVADILIQWLGLSAAFVVFPVASWGWKMAFGHGVRRLWLRVIAWIAAVLLGCITFAGFAVPQSWSLPIGLGGIIGDLIIAKQVYIGINYLNTWWLVIVSVSAGTLATLLFSYALVLSPGSPVKKTKQKTRAKKNQTNDTAKDPERNISAILIGGLFHLVYVIGYGIRRLIVKLGYTVAKGRSSAKRQKRVARASLENPDGLDDEIIASHDELPWNGDDTRYGDENHNGDKRLRVVRKAGSGQFILPPRNLLTKQKKQISPEIDDATLEANAKALEGVLDDFSVKGEILRVRPGPVVTLYELEPAPGIKSSRIIGLADDIARSMSALSARVSVVPGRNVIGIELPNEHRKTVYLREVFETRNFANAKPALSLCLGLAIDGEPMVTDLARMPHLLIAGTTGSGKSVGINTMILSLLYRLEPNRCRLILIDPKMLELSVYDGIPHLLSPVVTDPKQAVTALKWAVKEMGNRYRDMSRLGVRNIDGYNLRLAESHKRGENLSRTVQTGFDDQSGEAVFETEELNLEPMPHIVIVVDEMADLMMVAGKEIESAIQRLAQMARASGIHLIMATQRPSVDVITGTIKANFPTRISFQVTSKIDSRTILGEQGAEQLLGRGDMLYMQGGGRISRIHAPFVSDDEVEKVVAHLKSQGVPEYLDEVTSDDTEELGPDCGIDGGGSGDELYDRAVAVVLNDRKVSTSYIQRRLSIGYNRAATLIEKMEKEGLISAANHVGRREILVPESGNENSHAQ